MHSSEADREAYDERFPLLGLTFDDVLLLPGETDGTTSDVATHPRPPLGTR